MCSADAARRRDRIPDTLPLRPATPERAFLRVPDMNREPLGVGLLGLGTVGTGVARLLLEESARLTRRAGRPLELRRVVVRNTERPRDLPLPEGLLSDDVRTIVDDPGIGVVVEVMGGIEPARTRMLECLAAGKDVVTANKALLCEHGAELFARARELGRSISFEAAVAGGIPIIAGIVQSLTSNQILGLQGILNGTSNFILTEMLSREASYADVLREAQERGYAEADPTLDVDGTDAAQKLVLLAQLAYGVRVPLASFVRSGIDALELADLKYAAELGYAVKLLATARLVDGLLEMHVQPTLIRHDRPLAMVGGAFNMVTVEGDAVGRLLYAGPGAGRMPTASAVVADLVDVAVGRAALTFSRLDLDGDRPALPVQPPAERETRYYLRFNVLDRPHVLADIADILGRRGISLASVIQHEAPEPEERDAGQSPTVPLVIMTHRTSAGRFDEADRELDRLDCLRPPRVRMPVSD